MASEDSSYQKGASGRPIALEGRSGDHDGDGDGRLHSPSVARNKAVLREAFLELLPEARRVLEIASGTGEHAVHIAGARHDLHWTTSDPDPASRTSIASWIASHGDARVAGPLEIDASARDWGVEPGFDVIAAINMIHIAPFAACEGVFAGAARLTSASGRVFFYGPFAREGRHTSPSNAEFDASLKRRHPDWGVRDLDHDVIPVAGEHGFALARVQAMPANNLSVVFSRI